MTKETPKNFFGRFFHQNFIPKTPETLNPFPQRRFNASAFSRSRLLGGRRASAQPRGSSKRGRARDSRARDAGDDAGGTAPRDPEPPEPPKIDALRRAWRFGGSGEHEAASVA